MKKLPEYQDIKCLNIPKDIYYLLITNHWFIMLNTDYKIIGYFPRLAKTKHDKDIAFYNYVTNNCNVKHTFISFVPILGLGHSFSYKKGWTKNVHLFSCRHSIKPYHLSYWAILRKSKLFLNASCYGIRERKLHIMLSKGWTQKVQPLFFTRKEKSCSSPAR